MGGPLPPSTRETDYQPSGLIAIFLAIFSRWGPATTGSPRPTSRRASWPVSSSERPNKGINTSDSAGFCKIKIDLAIRGLVDRETATNAAPNAHDFQIALSRAEKELAVETAPEAAGEQPAEIATEAADLWASFQGTEAPTSA